MDLHLLNMVLCVLFFSTLVAWYIQFHFKRRRLYALAKKFDGPPTLPLIGNSMKCLMPLEDMADALLSISKYYKSPTRFWLGPYLIVYVYNPEDVKTVLNSTSSLEKPTYYAKLLEPLIGRGLVTAPVKQWRRHRKVIAPIFNPILLESFFYIFSRHSENLVDVLKDKEGTGTFDVHTYFIKYSLDTVLESLLDFDADENGLNDFDFMEEWFKVVLSTAVLKATNILYSIDFVFSMSSVGKKMLKIKKKFDKFIDLLMEKWQEDSINQNIIDETDETGHSKPKTLVEHLLSISDGNGRFTLEELRAEVNSIVVAGTETTSAVLGFLLIVLGIYQEVQEKVYEELINTLGDRNYIENGDLKKLEYMERVIKETLRIFPAQSGLARYSDREIQLENCRIPSHTHIIVGILSLHRDPSIWPNPTKFDPDRFLQEEESKRHPYSWIPFSAGPRNCIGIKFANMSTKIVLGNLLLNYKIDTTYTSIEDVHLTTMLAFYPTKGYNISISKRTGNKL